MGVVVVAGDGGDFSERLGALSRMMGVGPLDGHVEVDQVYAHYQHEGISRFTGRPLVYHRGGGSHYLQGPLFDHWPDYYRAVADELLAEDGDGALRAMKKNVEHLAAQVAIKAPVEFTNLRRSAHPWVTEGGETVYDRKPDQRRLTADELAALSKASGGHGYGRQKHHLP